MERSAGSLPLCTGLPFRAFAALALAGLASAQVVSRASVSSACAQANGSCTAGGISGGGRWVTFSSPATSLVEQDANGATADVFVRDLAGGITTLVSRSSSGVQGNFGGTSPAISADGRHVAFVSGSSNLVPGDTNGAGDVFVRDRVNGITTRVSVSSALAQGNHNSFAPAIPGEGRLVVFASIASTLAASDTNNAVDAFVHDRDPDGNGAFDEGNGVTARVSLGTGGTQAGGGVLSVPAISVGGRFAAFDNGASDLVSGDTNGRPDVFVHDRDPDGNGVLDEGNGVTRRVSVGALGLQADQDSLAPSISADGRFVAFESAATNLVPGDTNSRIDVFVHDRDPDGNGVFDEGNGATERVSVDSAGFQADDLSHNASISADGRVVAFSSLATNLASGDANGAEDVFVHDRWSRITSRVSSASDSLEAGGPSFLPRLSGDGGFALFSSAAANLVLGDTNGQTDVFVHDRGLAAPPFVSFCAPDAGAPCPCANPGAAGSGCDNSLHTGGAVLSALGSTAADTVMLLSRRELPSVTSVFLQSAARGSPARFGDGLLCLGGPLARIGVKSALGGQASYPQCGDASIRARSAALGDPIPSGATRFYQVWYRDPSPLFCPPPAGDAWNASQAIAIAW